MEMPTITRRYVTQTGDPLSPLFTSLAAGFERAEPGYLSPDLDLTGTDVLGFSGTTAGQAVLYGEGFAAQHAPRSLMVMLPGIAFRERAGAAVWKSHFLVLWGPLAEAGARATGQSTTAVGLSPAPGPVLNALFEAARLVVEQPPGWQWPCLRHVAGVLDYTQEHMSAQIGGPATLAAQAQAVMGAHLSAPLTLADLARRLQVSPSTLSHQFREQTGTSPALAYRRLRLAAARQLLANGVSVTETSRQLGFANQFYFSRLFRQMEGLPPRDFARIFPAEPRRKY